MLIETHNLSKTYGKKLALNKVNLKIQRGKFIAYLGTNGAGKSTTINLLTGLLKPTSGKIETSSDLRIGLVFQNSVLDNELTVKNNLLTRAKLYKNFSQTWLEKLVKLIGLNHFLNQKYGTLSGGQRRRVDIARALVNQPNLLFLDEPTAGLDLQTRMAIWNLLKKLQDEQGLTIFLTTHYLEEAEDADLIYILENGQILAEGSAKQIKREYAPSKLILQLKNKIKFDSKYQVEKLANNKVELLRLNSQQAIAVLNENKANILDFEYRQGSIDDAFIKITGKEIQ
ncbi:ABC transporter ATP-binding protein [Lactobacillus acetotolerans]|jgi:multidrug/hemolysin transport system ATP-binding protein|uniref:ABC transporter ATP-binding protein n=1 Tax=Lactobacillus acetotolerans TaxID=1600 RepID=UPI0007B86BE1|nr:ABC transporter ATP-binding protein [Lactobacillus acetotolerans]QGV04138.1 ATP-binding cassette domain-containing protein [Lactobacillus acetotolerans]